MTTQNTSTQPTISLSGLTVEHINLILTGLGEMQHKVVNGLYQGIKQATEVQLREFQAQQEAAARQAEEVVVNADPE